MIRLLVIALVIFSASCTRTVDRIPEPDNLIPRKKMVTVLKEMMKLEAHVQANLGQVSNYYIVMERSGDSLLSSYHLDRQIFESSMDYYGSRQVEMKAIYADALSQINEELGELEAK